MTDSPSPSPDRGVGAINAALIALANCQQAVWEVRLRDKRSEQGLPEAMEVLVEAASEARSEVQASIENTRSLLFDLLRITAR